MRRFYWEMFDECLKQRIDYGHAVSSSLASAKRMATKRLPIEFFFSDWLYGVDCYIKESFSKQFILKPIGRSDAVKPDWYSLKT